MEGAEWHPPVQGQHWCQRANAHLTEQLLQYKYNADTMLQYGDRNQIDYPRAEILSWTRARKSGLLKLLNRWHKRYLVAQLLETTGQRSLTAFGFTAYHAAGNGRDLDDPSTGDRVTRARLLDGTLLLTPNPG